MNNENECFTGMTSFGGIYLDFPALIGEEQVSNTSMKKHENVKVTSQTVTEYKIPRCSRKGQTFSGLDSFSFFKKCYRLNEEAVCNFATNIVTAFKFPRNPNSCIPRLCPYSLQTCAQKTCPNFGLPAVPPLLALRHKRRSIIEVRKSQLKKRKQGKQLKRRTQGKQSKRTAQERVSLERRRAAHKQRDSGKFSHGRNIPKVSRDKNRKRETHEENESTGQERDAIKGNFMELNREDLEYNDTYNSDATSDGETTLSETHQTQQQVPHHMEKVSTATENEDDNTKTQKLDREEQKENMQNSIDHAEKSNEQDKQLEMSSLKEENIEKQLEPITTHGESAGGTIVATGKSAADTTIASEPSAAGTTIVSGQTAAGTTVASGQSVADTTLASGQSVADTTVVSGQSAADAAIASGQSAASTMVASGQSTATTTVTSGHSVPSTTGALGTPVELANTQQEASDISKTPTQTIDEYCDDNCNIKYCARPTLRPIKPDSDVRAFSMMTYSAGPAPFQTHRLPELSCTRWAVTRINYFVCGTRTFEIMQPSDECPVPRLQPHSPMSTEITFYVSARGSTAKLDKESTSRYNSNSSCHTTHSVPSINISNTHYSSFLQATYSIEDEIHNKEKTYDFESQFGVIPKYKLNQCPRYRNVPSTGLQLSQNDVLTEKKDVNYVVSCSETSCRTFNVSSSSLSCDMPKSPLSEYADRECKVDLFIEKHRLRTEATLSAKDDIICNCSPGNNRRCGVAQQCCTDPTCAAPPCVCCLQPHNIQKREKELIANYPKIRTT